MMSLFAMNARAGAITPKNVPTRKNSKPIERPWLQLRMMTQMSLKVSLNQVMMIGLKELNLLWLGALL